MPRTTPWQPMQRTIDLIDIWQYKLRRNKMDADDIDALEKSILDHSISFQIPVPEGEKICYSDDCHLPKEAMLDFVLALSKCLSPRQLFDLTETVLTKQHKPLEMNTYMRNTELVRFLLMIEMGTRCHREHGSVHKTLIHHLAQLRADFSDEGLMNLVNTLFIGSLMMFRQDYHGLDHLKVPRQLTMDDICRSHDIEPGSGIKVSRKQPEPPAWIHLPKLHHSDLINQTLFKATANDSFTSKTVSFGP